MSIRKPGEPSLNVQPASDHFSVVFDEDFDQETLGDNWALSTENVGSYDLQLDGSLKLASLTSLSDGRSTVALSRTFEPLGDFDLAIDLSWNQNHVASSCHVEIELVGHDGNVMLRFGYSDGWVDYYGELGAWFYPTQANRTLRVNTNHHSMPLVGAVSFEIVRDRATAERPA